MTGLEALQDLRDYIEHRAISYDDALERLEVIKNDLEEYAVIKNIFEELRK